MENLSNINLFRYTDENGISDFIFSICTNDKPPVYHYFTFQNINNETQLIRVSNIMDFLSEGRQITEPININSPEYTSFINKFTQVNKQLFKDNTLLKLADILLSTNYINQANQKKALKPKN